MPAPLEELIARECQHIWKETPQNHVCGLLEEAVEVAHASDWLTKEQCLEIVTRCVERAYSQPGVIERYRPATLLGELADVAAMLCCVRQQTLHRSEDSLLDIAAEKIAILNHKFTLSPMEFAEKLQRKRDALIRL
jgi:NTP pyrophosphatase (non-canonical NTP hydrolase)